MEQGIRNVGKWYKLPDELLWEAGQCGVCGCTSGIIKVRGRHPREPERKVCGQCAREVLESIIEGCNNRDAARNALSGGEELRLKR